MFICDISVLNKFGKQRLDELLAPLHTNWREMIVLMVLEYAPGCSQSYLSAYLQMDKGNITKLINRMAAAGLIERQVDTSDKRNNKLYLKEKGLALLPAFHLTMQEWERKCYSGFSEEELAEYNRLTGIIVKHLMG